MGARRCAGSFFVRWSRAIARSRRGPDTTMQRHHWRKHAAGKGHRMTMLETASILPSLALLPEVSQGTGTRLGRKGA
jgi:hypothetical protein